MKPEDNIRDLKARAERLADRLGAQSHRTYLTTRKRLDGYGWMAFIYCPGLVSTSDIDSEVRTESAALRELVKKLEAMLRQRVRADTRVLNSKQ